MDEQILQIAQQFALPQGEMTFEPYGNGHINDTYRITVAGAEDQYILQRINTYVFPRPDEVMENIEHVTDYLREQIRLRHGDEKRETLTIVRTRDGKSFLWDGKDAWRVFLYIRDTISRDLPENEALFEECGEAFGRFQQMLCGFPAETLHESIRDFHNTPERMRQLDEAVRRNAKGRLESVAEELAFAEAHREYAGTLVRALQAGKIPLRVTHNDTKLNNVRLDAHSGKAVCILDLDTVMPGLLAYDFGDAIRTGASTADEDERDLSKVTLSLPMFRAFAKGYFSQLAPLMTAEEVESLTDGAVLMTFENGIRFLADYLNGDLYFKVHRDGHNLDRCRAQFALVRDMEAKKQQMRQILREEYMANRKEK